MKKCPYCAEEIQDQAIRCKHCQADLTIKTDDKPVTVDQYGQTGTFYHDLSKGCTWIIIIVIIGILAVMAYFYLTL